MADEGGFDWYPSDEPTPDTFELLTQTRFTEEERDEIRERCRNVPELSVDPVDCRYKGYSSCEHGKQLMEYGKHILTV